MNFVSTLMYRDVGAVSPIGLPRYGYVAVTGNPQIIAGKSLIGQASDEKSPAGFPEFVGRRLLSLTEAAVYCGLSYWTLRSLVLEGRLRSVRFAVGGRELRRILVDRLDLDAFIEAHKSLGVF